ncbi:MAG: 16S rRNA (uracil(1498)-N(3))-methyltransferase [Desulfuromonadales bacterium]|nr:16S rRNA (uracil(1498)-N(3))-methyltransferase [Desulfuromonadales bacterium]
MIPACVNDGGAGSLVQLEAVPPLDEPVVLTSQAVAALGRWQPRPGEIYTVVDPYRTFYRARLIEWTPEKGVVIPFQRLSRPVESPVAVEVYQALPEKERFELILQKLTEIGVARIVPYISQRSTTVEERDAGQKKSHRWPQVILRAARQCRRGMLPELYPVLSWDQATWLATSADLKLLLFEGEAPWSLREALRNERPARVALVVGPEGGFAPEEAEAARNLGFLPVSVGPRLLRTETAAIVGAALVQYGLGDLGG